MKKLIKAVLILMITTTVSSSAMAHALWVNVFESFAHPPGHALVALGWGHSVPLDDILATNHAILKLKSYEVIDPDMERTAMPMPIIKMEKEHKTSSGVIIQKGDLGIRKIGLTKDSTPGTYQIVAESKESFFTSYIDKKGKSKFVGLSMDKVKNYKEMQMSIKYIANAKSFMTVKKWTPPQPLGYDLEIIPDTDLSKLKAGELVKFKVTYMGRPVSVVGDKIQYLTLSSNTYGGPDGFFLSAYVMNGKAQFRIPTAGQWVASLFFKQPVKGNKKLAHLKNKCKTIFYSGTVSFTVKP